VHDTFSFLPSSLPFCISSSVTTAIKIYSLLRNMSRTFITNAESSTGPASFPSTVTIEGDHIFSIGQDPSDNDATIVDAKNGVLPGLIDSHIHLHGPENLKQFAQNGVTTCLDMAPFSPALISALHTLADAGGLTDVRTPGILACAPGSRHSHIPGFPANELVDAARFVKARIDEGVDYIKIIADEPGFDQQTFECSRRKHQIFTRVEPIDIEFQEEATKHGKMTIAHAAQHSAFQRALDAKTKVLTHVPTDKPLDSEFCRSMLAQESMAVPTLTMMEGVINNLKRPGLSYAAARDSVKAMHEAGVPILAGTDANMQPGVPANVMHGESMHHELELLVDAGLSNIEPLQAATSLPAKYFELNDRGVIEVGKRADLVLINGDPIADIKATRSIQKVWYKGVEVDSA
jgi:imidazolonepropionase-like amidohydrolase